ncbi:MAG: transposase, partial [Sedimentisphaerales bacterium]|nr:transposase [Sedimentisphaerales bacterium]
CWVIPPKQNAAFVANMEDVLELYKRPYNPAIPVICMDEQPTQLIKEVRTKIPVEPGKPERVDCECERKNETVKNMLTENLADWSKVNVRERKTSIEWEYEIKELLDEDYTEVVKVILVCDNLNKNTIAAFYEELETNEVRKLAENLEIHYKHKNGSWLNVAEIVLSVFTKKCLDRRIPDMATLQQEAKAWYRKRNTHKKGVDWQFTTEDARVKLKRLYPQIQML